MSPERWLELRSLLDAALQREPAERGAFLKEACADSLVLREAGSLLAAIEDAGSFIEKPAVPRAAETRPDDATPDDATPDDATPDDATAPARIGVYEIDRLLGEGGMGRIYLATRADDVFKKRVAVKVLKRGMDTAEVVRRFRGERQILANLVHPNIAQVLDGGSTPEGLPYLVMEHVEGTPIDLYCDRGRLGVTARLELFRKVCDAVHFAHQNLVVHRDLKPANVLVARGEPKLLDFGIAKLLDAADFPQTVMPTLPGSVLMTPEYASPEQVLGQAVTTASDVYSLGVVLFQLLTGHRPYHLESRRPESVKKAVCETEPPRTSAVVGRTVEVPAGDGVQTLSPAAVAAARGTDPRRLSRRLAGDLDNIVLEALRKDPRRRYLSAEQLAADLGRHLEGRPVRARPDTFAYRASKFVQRHRAAVAVAALLVLLAGGFVATLWIQRRQVIDQRDRAELVSDLLTQVFELPDPVRSLGESITAREILDRGTERIAENLAGRPDVKSGLDATLGRTYKNLGLYPEAREHLESAADALRSGGGGKSPGFAEVLELLAEVLALEGELGRAGELAREALTLRRGLNGDDHPAVVTSLVQLARLDERAGSYERAREGFRQALERARRGGDAETLALVLDRFGQLATRTGDDAEAERLLEEALAIYRRLGGDEHPEVPTTMNNLALAVQGRDPERAEELLETALEVQRRRYREARPSLADSVENLGHLVFRRGRYDEAEPLYLEALALHHQVYGERHPKVAGALNKLALLSATRGELEKAERLYREALDMQRELLGESHAETAGTLANLGQVLVHQGRLDEAEEVFASSLEATRRALGDGHAETGIVLASLATVAQARGDVEAAERRYGEAVDVLRAAGETVHLAGVLHNLASLLRSAGRPEDARARFREALELNAAHLGDDHPEVAMIKTSLALIEGSLGASTEAETLAREALAVFDGGLPADSPWTAAARRALGVSLAAQARHAEAEPWLTGDHEWLRRHQGANDPATRRAVERLIELYDAWGRADESARYRRLAAEMDDEMGEEGDG